MGKRKAKVSAETPVGRAMARVLPPKVEDVLTHEQSVRGASVEGVHDMRVATKRLREATRLFLPALGRKRMKRHLAHLELLNDTLGAVRDLDVLQIEVTQLGGGDGALSEGLAPLLADLQDRREQAGRRLEGVLDETLGYLEGDFAELIHDKPKKRAKVRKMAFAALGCLEIGERTQAAFAMEQAARVPEASAEFHRMRIAIKKVKYALQLFLDAIGKPAKKAYPPISELQELMGLVHDRDVLIATVQGAAGAVLSPEVAVLATTRAHEQRDRLHADTLALLDEIRERRTVKGLLKATCRRAGP
jgi:CHAD domain-containing protein